MSKIVFPLPDMPGGGTERVVANLANKFVEKGYSVDILLFAGNTVAYELDDRINIIKVGTESSGNPLIRLKRIGNMRKYYKENIGCHIFAFANMGCVFSTIAAAGLAHTMLVSERNDPRRVPWQHKIVRNWAYSKADKLVFQTEDSMKLFSKKIQKKSVVISNPVSDNLPDYFVGARPKKIVNVARLEPQKNHKLLIKAFAEFYKEYPDFSLEIYGQGGMDSELKALATELELDKAIVFHGFSSNVKDEIKDASMFVLSSDYEGISNAMVEALAMGIPTISTDCPIGGARAYIEDGINGLLTPVGDANALAEAMKKLAKNADIAYKMSQNALSIRDKYSLDNIAKEFLIAANL